MQRHLTDPPRTNLDTIRLREFLRLARAENANPAVNVLARQVRAPRSASVLRAYLRIDRGHRA